MERRCPACGTLVPADAVYCVVDSQVLVPADQDPLLGTQAGPWRVVKRLGVGGMGAVYEVCEVNIGRRAAMKVVHPQLARDPRLPQLLEEAKAATAINDEGLVDVFGFGWMENGRPWLVMELLEGESLEARLTREKRLPVEDTLRLGIGLLKALEAAHAAGVIHRDIKPANVFLETRPDGGTRPRLLDLGLAKRLTDASPMAVGTPDYVAPEQARNEPVGPRADLYAFGCMLFELLTGTPPFARETALDTVQAHFSVVRPSLATLAPSVPEGLVAVVRSLMELDPRARPASAHAVRESLLLVQRSLQPVEAPVALASPGRRRGPWLLAGVLLAGAAVVLAVRLQPAPVPPPEVPAPEDPMVAAVIRAAAQVAEPLRAGKLTGPDGAASRLQSARASFPDRPEWSALTAEVTSSLRDAARAALARDDLDGARAALQGLRALGAADEALGQEEARASFALHAGMVHVGHVFIDRYEYPNKAGALPTTRVDWEEAVALCDRAGKHLCREEEWEAACSGAAHRRFPWGDEPVGQRCLKRGRGVRAPERSGQRARCVSPEGVFDLSGNVAEWTASPLQEGAPQRVLRGGSFVQSDQQLGCTARDYLLPGQGGNDHLGLRCCL
jgi:tRNA A-37 threonylcarbamoyl transferase component Bud32